MSSTLSFIGFKLLSWSFDVLVKIVAAVADVVAYRNRFDTEEEDINVNEEKKKRAGGQGVRSVKLEDVIIWYETSAQKGMQISTNRIHIKEICD
jgi:hypothetical protein